MAEARIRLVTQGDDLGMNHSTNLAIVEAFRKGMLRQAAIMTPGPAVDEAAALLAAEKELGISLHTCLNAEWDAFRWGPVAGANQVPSLVDRQGLFFQTTRALWENQPRTEHILVELQAQLDKARDLGFNVTFADTHMLWSAGLKENEHLFHEWRRRNGLREHKHYDRLPDIKAQVDPVERLILQLKRAAPGQYRVGGHPAYDNAEMRALGHPGYEGDIVAMSREWDRRIFTDPRILAFCATNDIRAIRHDEAV